MIKHFNTWVLVTILLAACSGEPQKPQPGSRFAVEPPPADPCDAVGGERLLHVPSPDWRDQIVYQMFTDRFNDGDPSNNDQGADEFKVDSPSHYNGGDLQGIIDRISYLQDLGITAIWHTPPVLNQWWSTPYDAAGWHGYWAVNFKEVDPHFGTLDTYKDLSHRLHCNGMYLIQDIVINHVGNFYDWSGPYNPDDPAENFYLVEEGNTAQVAPTQFPFNKIDVRDPDHRAVGAYHWTPAINDYNDPHQQTHYGFGLLGDINTENPVVLEAFKDSYRYWIEEVGVDAYRIDTVAYVAWPFWHHFLHDADGIFPAAAATGRDHFLAFGEVLVPSEPFKTDGETKILRFLGSADEPGLNSMLGFPLYFSMRRVLTEGQPVAQLAYRLEQHMLQYPDPYVIPIFIDNHDTARFLATGGYDAFRQALALVFTLPGIPVIYQGTEQALTETRQAMFDGGWKGRPGQFDQESATYQLVSQLAALRKGNHVLTRGELQVLAGEELGAGLLAYRRDHDGRSIIVLMNTADHAILVHRLDASLESGQLLEPLFTLNFAEDVAADAKGRLSLELPARAVAIFETGDISTTAEPVPRGAVFTFDRLPGPGVLTEDFVLTGTIDRPFAELELIVNGDLDRPQPFKADGEGRWRVTLPVRDLGESRKSVKIFDPASNTLSRVVTYRTRVDEAALQVRVEDTADDAQGPTGDYVVPQNADSGRQREILAANARAAGRNLELTLIMAQLTDVWAPPNGFDNVAFSIFFEFPDRPGATALPLINADMPFGRHWNLAHVSSGWFSYTYTALGAAAERQGDKLGVAPATSVNKAEGSVRFFYEGARLGVDDWSGVTIYITTWDLNGEGGYVLIAPQPTLWYFSGASPDSPLILDDLMIELPKE